MVLVELNEINMEKSSTGSYNIEIIFFKDKLINLLLINKTLEANIIEEVENNLHLRYINFGQNGIGLKIKTNEVGSILENVKGIIVQKSKKYENYKSGFVAYNIISYNLNTWKSENYFKKGFNYTFSDIDNTFIGIRNKTSNYIEFRPKLNLLTFIDKKEVELNNLLYFPQKNLLLGYKNNFVNDALSYIPLLKPVPQIEVEVRNKDNSDQLLFFENNTKFIIQSIEIDEEINETFINVRSLRITKEFEIDDNTDKFEQVDLKFTSTNNFYNINFLEFDNYTFNVNIVSITFINNFSSKQENNKILINKFTNQTINTIYLNERTTNNSYDEYIWGEQLPLITKDSYLNLKLTGIKQSKLFELLNTQEINIKLIVINKNESVLDVYLNILDSSEYKINKNTDNYGEIKLKNNAIQIIPKAKNNTNGLDGLIGIKVIESNINLFNDLIINDITVKVAGIQSNLSKILINLNRPYQGDINFDSTLNYSSNNVIYSNILKISAINDNFFNRLQVRDNLEFINEDGDPDIIAGKNPKIINLKQVVIRRFKLKITEDEEKIDFLLERQTYDDKSLDGYIDDTSLISYLNPSIIGTEAEKLYFDLSDKSCLRKTIKFYIDISCNKELLYPNFLNYVTYSRNNLPGEEGSYIELEIPDRSQRNNLSISNESPIIYFKIENVNQVSKKATVCLINIKTLKRLHHGEISVTDIQPNNLNSGILEYDNAVSNFYDPELIKPRIDVSFNLISMSDGYQNFFTYKDNIFNNVHFVDVDDNKIGIDCSNTNVFIGDNMIMSEETYSLYELAFYLRNTNLIEGIVRIGISSANKITGNYNTDLFEIINNKLSLLQYPKHIENTEKTQDSNVNKTNYIVYVTSKFSNNIRPQQVKYLVKYSQNEQFNVSNYIESIGKLNETILSNDYNGSHIKDVYLVGYIKDDRLYLSLIIISENSDNQISYFQKIRETEIVTENTSLFILSDNNILNYYKNLSNISTDIEEINTKLYYNQNNSSLKLAYIRKKFNFIPVVNSNYQDISKNDIILFQPISLYYNKENHTQEQNHYLIAFFDTDNNKEYIKFFKIILQKDEPFFLNLDNTTNAKIANNVEMVDIWYPGTKYGLFLTKPVDLINIYTNRKNQSIVFNEDDTAINTPQDFTVLKNLTLPLLDSTKYSDYTIELRYKRRLFDNARIEIRLFKKNNLDIHNPTLISDVISIKKNEFDSYYDNLSRSDILFDIDPSGQIILNLPGDYNLVSGKNNIISTPYVLTYQIANYLDNTVFIQKLTESKKFFNFTNLTPGEINTYQPKRKRVLNIRKMRTPLKLNDNESDVSKNEFNLFLTTNNVNTIINKQSKLITERIKYQDRSVDLSALTKTGIGTIRYYCEEINQSLNVDISSAYTGIYGEDILFNVVNVGIIENIRTKILNEKEVQLDWDFNNDNLTVTVLFIVYRSQEVSTNKTYTEIGRTTNRFFRDYTAIPFLQAFYKIESIIQWEGINMSTGLNYTETFICENNNFEYGRYNNTTDNPKLYKPINTSCGRIGMVGITKTGNLFSNSITLTKKELYTELSRAKFRPFR